MAVVNAAPEVPTIKSVLPMLNLVLARIGLGFPLLNSLLHMLNAVLVNT